MLVRKDNWSGPTTGLTVTGLIVIILHYIRALAVVSCMLTRRTIPGPYQDTTEADTSGVHAKSGVEQ